MIDTAEKTAKTTADTHQKFLEFSNELSQGYSKTFALQTKLLELAIQQPEASIPHSLRGVGPNSPSGPEAEFPGPDRLDGDHTLHHTNTINLEEGSLNQLSRTRVGRLPHSEFSIPPPNPAFSRQDCLEFATGSVARVLGPEFAAVDDYPARVRLPDEPLMLVDRILSIEGEKGIPGPGTHRHRT